jgi:hypothetical protein
VRLLVLTLACAERALPLADLTLAEFAGEYGREVCARELRCGFLDENEIGTCRVWFAAGWDALSDRNYRFDAGAANRCLDGLRALDCKPLSFQHCDGVVTATGARGQPCAEDCAGGLRCDQKTCACVPAAEPPAGKRGLGAACQAGTPDQCGAGLFCKPPGSCQPPSAVGETCFNTAASYAACQPGLVCQGAEYPLGTCDPFVGEGGVCLPLEPCGEGLRCAARGRCMRPLAENSPCMPGDECRDFTLCTDGFCLRPTRTLGELCDPRNDNCSVGYCRAGRCERALALGAACDPKASIKQCRIGSCSRGTCTRCP